MELEHISLKKREEEETNLLLKTIKTLLAQSVAKLNLCIRDCLKARCNLWL